MTADAPGGAPVCARAGCRAPATAQVVWRNPRIHPVGRRKVWAACDEHTAYLYDYLAARRFPVAIEPLPAGDRCEETR